MDYNKL